MLTVSLATNKLQSHGTLCALVSSGYISVFLGYAYVDPSSGVITPPYETHSYSFRPANPLPRQAENPCSHTIVNGVVTLGSISSSNGVSSSVDIDDPTPPSSTPYYSPGLVMWPEFLTQPGVPGTTDWPDGLPAFGRSLFQGKNPFMMRPEVRYRYIDPRSSRRNMEYESSITTSSFVIRRFVLRDPTLNATYRGSFAWDPVHRYYSPVQGNDVAQEIYCWPLGKPEIVVGVANPDAIRDECVRFARSLSPLESSSRAVLSACEGFGSLGINNLENSGSLSFADLFPLSALKQIKKNPVKGLSALFLWYKYSFIPNLSDSQVIYSRIGDVLANVRSDQKSYGTSSTTGYYQGHSYTHKQNVCIEGQLNAYTELQRISQQIASIGLNPSVSNLWDLVPFSFVVDWFIPIGDTLSRVEYESNIILNRWNISSVEYSSKLSMVLSASTLATGAAGYVEVGSYARSYSKTLPYNSLDFGAPKPRNHIMEGAALVIANYR